MFYSPSFPLVSGTAAMSDLEKNNSVSLWTVENYEEYKKYNTFTAEQRQFRLQKYLVMSLVAAESFQLENKQNSNEPFFDIRLDEFAEEWLEHQPEDDASTQVGSVSTSITFNSVSNHFRKNSDGLIDASILKLSREKDNDNLQQSVTYGVNENNSKSKKNLIHRQFQKLSLFFRRSSNSSLRSTTQIL
ncbi:hypothetical protein K502DRAFT_361883 [Neoconidiobolus thromboides FSU 785]|nr:hypothetical protein K502DRAFT_361883 [Neoconidiobolus thromboides FSU 785]